jgi:hypothetical protein
MKDMDKSALLCLLGASRAIDAELRQLRLPPEGVTAKERLAADRKKASLERAWRLIVEAHSILIPFSDQTACPHCGVPEGIDHACRDADAIAFQSRSERSQP